MTDALRPDNAQLRRWNADPQNEQCWGLDGVADYIERLERELAEAKHSLACARQDVTAHREAHQQAARERDAKFWECPECMFKFDAFHKNQDGTYSCPVCELAKLSATCQIEGCQAFRTPYAELTLRLLDASIDLFTKLQKEGGISNSDDAIVDPFKNAILDLDEALAKNEKSGPYKTTEALVAALDAPEATPVGDVALEDPDAGPQDDAFGEADLRRRAFKREREAVQGEGLTLPERVLPEGTTLVPLSALAWLNGEEGEFTPPDVDGSRAVYWWRSEFRRRITDGLKALALRGVEGVALNQDAQDASRYRGLISRFGRSMSPHMDSTFQFSLSAQLGRARTFDDAVDAKLAGHGWPSPATCTSPKAERG